MARLWREWGTTVVDADQLAREVVAPGSEGLQAVVEAFGPQVIASDGSMDRKAVGALVFDDPDALQTLNEIIHPLVSALAQQRLREAPEPFAVYDVPLLVETGGHKKVDAVVVVAVDKATQVARIMERNGLNEEEARKRIASQLPLDQKVAAADYVIRNQGTLEELRFAAGPVWEALRQRYR